MVGCVGGWWWVGGGGWGRRLFLAALLGWQSDLKAEPICQDMSCTKTTLDAHCAGSEAFDVLRHKNIFWSTFWQVESEVRWGWLKVAKGDMLLHDRARSEL